MKAKLLWKGRFNFRCEFDVIYTRTYSKEQARVVMCRRLAKKHGVLPHVVLLMFKGDTDNFDIVEEKDEKSMVRR